MHLFILNEVDQHGGTMIKNRKHFNILLIIFFQYKT